MRRLRSLEEHAITPQLLIQSAADVAIRMEQHNRTRSNHAKTHPDEEGHSASILIALAIQAKAEKHRLGFPRRCF